MSQLFFEKINYSASNEDSESERKALQLNSQDVVLCITGSGARALDLLVDSPAKVISIDLNPSQNFLLELKIAAFRVLNYQQFAAFIGLKPSVDRLQVYEKLRLFLPDLAKDYWDKQSKTIENGVLYCGTWERFLRNMRKLAVVRAGTLHRLLNASSINQQAQIWQSDWDNALWRAYLKIITNRFLWVHLVREPGAALIDKDFDIYAYMKARLDVLATRFSLQTNHYANLLFHGNYTENCILPHHLQAENFELIKQNLDKIETVTESLDVYLSQCPQKFSAFSLSDFSSYAPSEVYANTWKAVIHSAQNKAKFCERQFLVKSNPEQFSANIKRNAVLENHLNETDETAIYTFCVGLIEKEDFL